MQKISLVTLLTAAALLLAACSAPAASSGVSGDPATTTASDSLPLQFELALGTLKLEGTDQAVTPEQAATLLPLWKAAQALPGLDTTAPAEIEALYAQIRDTMTASQISAIEALNLTSANMDATAAELGLTMNGPGRGSGAAPSAEMQATRAARRASGSGQGAAGGPSVGGVPGGGMPGAGGPPPDMAGMTGGATTGAAGSRSGGSSPFVQAVITLLEQKIP